MQGSVTWLSKRITAQVRPVGVCLTSDAGKKDVTERLLYAGWHDGAHAWQLPLEEAERDLIGAGRMYLSVDKLALKQGLVVTEPGVSLQDFSWGEEPCS